MRKYLFIFILITGLGIHILATVTILEPRPGSKYIIGIDKNIVLKMDKNYSQYKLELLKSDGANLGIIKQGTWRTLMPARIKIMQKIISWKFGKINGRSVPIGAYKIKATVSINHTTPASHTSSEFKLALLRAYPLKGDKPPSSTNQQPPPPVPLKRPDLIISNVTFFNNNGFKATVTVQNIGPKESKPCTLELKIGCSGEGFKFLEFNIPALNAKNPNAPDVGCAHIVHVELIFGGHLPFNEAKSFFTIDSKGVVWEEDENNNRKIFNNCLQ